MADCLREHLRDEYEADYAKELDAATPTRLIRLTLSVPLPKPVLMAGVVPDEVTDGGTLKIA